MCRNVTITYELNLPADTPTPTSPTAAAAGTSNTLTFSVPSESADLKTYYANLREAVRQARNKVGEELTVWKGVVGSRELRKEVGKGEEEEEEGEEEENEEGEA